MWQNWIGCGILRLAVSWFGAKVGNRRERVRGAWLELRGANPGSNLRNVVVKLDLSVPLVHGALVWGPLGQGLAISASVPYQQHSKYAGENDAKYSSSG